MRALNTVSLESLAARWNRYQPLNADEIERLYLNGRQLVEIHLRETLEEAYRATQREGYIAERTQAQ